MRRIGVLMNLAADSEGQARHRAFVQALQELGWSDDRNVRLDTRWGAAGSTLMSSAAFQSGVGSLRSVEHHRAALLPVAASTTTAPVMCGCTEQKYS
jgi:hypothetical protein